MAEIVYRRVLPEDLDAVCALEEICFPEEPWSRQMFEEELENDSVLFVAAEAGPGYEGPLQDGCGRLLGYIVAWIIPPYESQVGSIAVLPCARRCGIGTQLMEILFGCCRELGTGEIYLEVRVSNTAARELYRSLGFVTDGLRRNYYQDGEDAFTMARKETE